MQGPPSKKPKVEEKYNLHIKKLNPITKNWPDGISDTLKNNNVSEALEICIGTSYKNKTETS